MITDAQIAGLCCAVYGRPEAPPVHFDHFDQGHDDGICWGMVRTLGVDVIVLRGSVTLRDWIRDFAFIGNPFAHRDLKDVHYGFMFGMPEMWQEAKQLVGNNVVVCGHSLGAARADVLSALMMLEKRPPLARVVFGEPMPGFASFADIIKPIPARSYCNGDNVGHDLVTDVPFAEADAGFPYVHPSPLISVSASPPPTAHGAWRYHDIALYMQALRQRIEQ